MVPWIPTWVLLVLFVVVSSFFPYVPLVPNLVETRKGVFPHIDLAHPNDTEVQRDIGFRDISFGYRTPLGAIADSNPAIQLWLRHLSPAGVVANCYIFDEDDSDDSLHQAYLVAESGSEPPPYSLEPNSKFAPDITSYRHFAMCRVLWKDITDRVANELVRRELRFTILGGVVCIGLLAGIATFFMATARRKFRSTPLAQNWFGKLTIASALIVSGTAFWGSFRSATPAALSLGHLTFLHVIQSADQLWVMALVLFACSIVSTALAWRSEFRGRGTGEVRSEIGVRVN
jgi:hypothetical protein